LLLDDSFNDRTGDRALGYNPIRPTNVSNCCVLFSCLQFFLYAEESTTPIHREHEHVHHHVGDTGAYESLDGGEAEDDDEYEAMLDTQSPAR
jgi:hypothetical protein